LELTYIVLLALAIVYVPIYVWVRKGPRRAGRYGLRKYGPTIMVETEWGKRLMDRLAGHTRFWRAFGAVSIALMFLMMALIVYILAMGALNLPSAFSSPGMGLEYTLAIPGLNPLLPIWYGLIGLIAAMVIHELAHGFQSRANGIGVESTGVLYCVVPLGAFVNPDEKDVEKASRRAKLDLYAAGVSINVISAAVVFLLFAVLMLGGISSPYGDNAAVYQVTGDSPASDAGIPTGAIILEVDGERYAYSSDLGKSYSWSPGDMVSVKYLLEDGEHEAEMRWGLYIERVTSDPAGQAGVERGSFLISVTDKASGVKTQIYGYPEFISYMGSTRPGMTVALELMDRGGAVSERDVTLGSKGDIGFLGIATTTSGMNFRTPAEILDIARNPLHGADTPREAATSMLGYMSGPFNGFSPMPEKVHWWYDAPMGDAFWILLAALYWIFWLNLLLGISNALPAFPFDGGFAFLLGLDSALERIGVRDPERRERISGRISGIVSSAVLVVFLLITLSVAL
jgi:membrane-associated protease RseP (regulator of RpoE activity)